MAICTICKKTQNETKLFEGIFNTEMVNICKECARSENIPIIQKPSETQLDKADERHSVRERMERISGLRKTEISKDQITTQGNLAKLRIPPKKQFHEDVLDNYYWTLSIARRRKKLTTNQLAKQTQIDAETIHSIEKGKIPENFEEIFSKLESFLNIKLLKKHKAKTHFIKPTKDEAEKILKEVKEKMGNKDNKEEDIKTKKEKLEKLSKGELDFSKREDFSNITLNDLVEMKKSREKRELKRKTKAQEEAMLGEDLELE